jgi:hypothetical protein
LADDGPIIALMNPKYDFSIVVFPHPAPQPYTLSDMMFHGTSLPTGTCGKTSITYHAKGKITERPPLWPADSILEQRGLEHIKQCTYEHVVPLWGYHVLHNNGKGVALEYEVLPEDLTKVHVFVYHWKVVRQKGRRVVHATLHQVDTPLEWIKTETILPGFTANQDRSQREKGNSLKIEDESGSVWAGKSFNAMVPSQDSLSPVFSTKPDFSSTGRRDSEVVQSLSCCSIM